MRSPNHIYRSAVWPWGTPCADVFCSVCDVPTSNSCVILSRPFFSSSFRIKSRGQWRHCRSNSWKSILNLSNAEHTKSPFAPWRSSEAIDLKDILQWISSAFCCLWTPLQNRTKRKRLHNQFRVSAVFSTFIGWSIPLGGSQFPQYYILCSCFSARDMIVANGPQAFRLSSSPGVLSTI